MTGPSSSWPRLDYAADEGTIETLHLLLQLIGKLPLRLHPWLNHGWHVALRMTPRGAITRSLPAGDRHFAAELDFREGAIRIECDNGSQSALPVVGRTIARARGIRTPRSACMAHSCAPSAASPRSARSIAARPRRAICYGAASTWR